MKLTRLLTTAIAALLFFSCQKETSFENGVSEGSLKQDVAGVCLPSSVGGIFKEDSLLNTTNYVDLQVNISEAGSYIIKSDTVNGYSFYGTGSFSATGLNNVRVFASGRPTDPGVNTFTMMYDSSACSIDVTVISVGPPGTYTLSGAGGPCTGAVANGTYTAGTAMAPGNTLTLSVDVTATGSYTITTPVVNGVSFSGLGDFATTGAQTVTLNATGTPILPGPHTYPINANSSSCNYVLTVTGPAGPAVFTLGGAGAACTGVVLAGTYAAGTPMNATNTATIDVNVTATGSYAISTTAANGVTFSNIGSFATTGAQQVTLTASGTPTAAATTTHTVNGSPGTCTFPVTYTAGTPQAAYTLNGGPAACTGATTAGTYTAGTALTAANTVTINVTVTTLGAYSISTNTVNGYSFSKTGTFSTLGSQPVVLNGTGTPTAAGTNAFTFTGGASTCTFSVTVTGGGGQAAYTLNGGPAPGACTGATVQGTYSAGTVLTAANTVTINVTVTTLGTYSISTNTVNGYSFSKTGTFSTLGSQPVILNGTGTPTAAGTNAFTFTGGTSTCTFSVTVTGAPPPTIHLTATLNGTPMTFNVDNQAVYVAPGFLVVIGYVNATSDESFAIGIENLIGTTITTGTYTMAGSGTNYQVYGEYEDPAGMFWDPSDGSVLPKDPWTITITFIDATRVAGTFSGTIRDDIGEGPNTKTVTNGSFNVLF